MDLNASKRAQRPMEILEELLHTRFSCRAFLPDPVPRLTIERIVAAAQKTASACNAQPWQVEITSGTATKRFREAMFTAASAGKPLVVDLPFPREYSGVYLARRREVGFQLYNALGIPRSDKLARAKQELENFNFFGAPHVALIHTDETLGPRSSIDCGGYLMTFTLAAQALGIATIPQSAFACHCDVVRAHFGLGQNRHVLFGISFGYADHRHRANSYRTSRAPISDAARYHDE